MGKYLATGQIYRSKRIPQHSNEMASNGATQSSGACGGQVEEDDEESSSSSLTASSAVEDELESFRQNWKQDLSGASGNLGSFDNENVAKINQKTEEKARDLFFEAIQKYRKAVNLVPDIENKVEEQRCRNDQNDNTIKSKEKEVEGDQTDEELEDIDPEDPEVNEESDLMLKFSRMRLKGHSSQDVDTSSSSTLAHISSLPMEVLILFR